MQREKWQRVAPYGVLAGFVAAILWPLCGGQSLYWGDILLYFEPMYRFGQQEIRAGHLPLWNPLILGGQPYVGNPQMGVFYPTFWLLGGMPVWAFLSLVSGLHLWLAGVFMYCYLGGWTERRSAALVGAMVYCGSAFLVGRLQFPPMVQAAAYLPLLLWGVDLSVRGARWKGAFCLGAGTGAMVLASHAQIAYLSLLCVGGYALCRCVGRREWRKTLVWMGGALGVGLLLTAVQTLPSLQLLAVSPREALTPGQANRFYLEPVHLLTLLFPRFLGHPASGDFWGEGNAWEPALFVGWLPLMFVGVACLQRRRERMVRFWGGVALLALWLAFGSDAGLYWLAFYAVPGISVFHDPARFAFWLMAALAILAALGWDRWLTSQNRWQRVTLPALLGVAFPLIWYGWDWNPTTSPSALQPSKQAPSLSGRTYYPQHELFWKRYITAGYSDYLGGDRQVLAAFLATRMPNLGMRQGEESASYYEPVPVDGPTRLDGMARIALRRGEPNITRLMALMGADSLELPVYRGMNSGARVTGLVPSGKQGEVATWKNREALPRAWVVYRVRQVEGRTRVIAALGSPEFDPRRVAVVSGETQNAGISVAEAEISSENLPLAEPVNIIGRMESVIRIKTPSLTEPGCLVYSGTAYPGWKATVDGKPASIHCVNGASLGVFLPPGAHQVRLEYAPDGFRIGLYLSLIGGGVIGGGGGFWMGRRWGRGAA